MNYKEFQSCGVYVVVNMIAGKWKPLILHELFRNSERFSNLWRMMPRVSKKVLIEQLKQMEKDELIVREERSGFPPEVYYRLSDKGRSLGPILKQMEVWNSNLT